jgi:hypothetical protein
MLLGVPIAILFPAYAILLAIHFWRTAAGAEGAQSSSVTPTRS